MRCYNYTKTKGKKMNIIQIFKSWISQLKKNPEINQTITSDTENVDTSQQRKKKKYCWMHKGQDTVFIDFAQYEKYVSLGYKRGRAKKITNIENS